VQSHRIPGISQNSTYDGVAEVFFDGLDAVAAFKTAKEYLEGALADEPNFIDMKRVEWMATQDRIINDEPAKGLVKGIFQLGAKPGSTHQDFRKHWAEIHSKVALGMPGIRRYVQSQLIDEAYDYARPRFDGVAHVYFESAEAMADSFASQGGKDDLADGELFIDMPNMTFFVARELVVIEGR